MVDNKMVKQMITADLKEAINTAIGNQQQVILFQNRRGYAPYKLVLEQGYEWTWALIAIFLLDSIAFYLSGG